MELSPQTNRIVVTSGKTVSFIPVLPNASQAHTLTLPYAPSSASIHPILQDRFVTGSTSDEWVRIHDVAGEEREVLKGHHGPVHCVEFSPDGEMFASGSGELIFVIIFEHFSATRIYSGGVFTDTLVCRGWYHPALADNSWEELRAMARSTHDYRLKDFYSIYPVERNALLECRLALSLGSCGSRRCGSFVEDLGAGMRVVAMFMPTVLSHMRCGDDMYWL